MSGHSLLDVLRQLSHKEFVSGAEVAARAGCSRATIHNVVGQAEAAGIRIHAVRGRGYRLAAALDWLHEPALRERLEPRGMHLERFDTLPSTNTHLLALAQAGASHRTVVVTEWQTGGRGRRGRTWLAPPGAGVQFSLLWRFGRSMAELSGLSLAVGVLLVQALRSMGLSHAMVKWPNDILLDEAKLAGVLIEIGGEMLGPTAAVIGVGLNVRNPPGLSESIGQPVADLGSLHGGASRTATLLALLESLDDGLARFDAQGFSAFRESWHACHAHQGQRVVLTDGQGGRTEGVALGVDEQGALLLEARQGVRRFHAGEVSLRGAQA